MLKTITLLILVSIVLAHRGNKPIVTLITGYWNIGRGEIDPAFRRTNENYLKLFEKHLQTPSNMIIFGDQTLKMFVQEKRKHSNTVFVLKDLESFRKQWYTSKIQNTISKLKKQPEWEKLSKMPQYCLDMYNPITMSKLFLMTQAIQHDIFDSDFYSWVNAGFLHDYNDGEGQKFIDKKSIEHMHNFYQNIWYFRTTKSENTFQGFDKGEFRYLPIKIPQSQMVRSNYFGGKIEAVSTMKSIYENFLRITLEKGDMNTDESVFTIMRYRYPYFIPVVSRHEAKDLSQRQMLQNTIYLQLINHRQFQIKGNGSFVAKEYVAIQNGKDAKVAREGEGVKTKIIENSSALEDREASKQKSQPHQASLSLIEVSPWKKDMEIQQKIGSQISPFDYLPKQIPLNLTETLAKYKLLFLSRGIFCLAFFGFYYALAELNKAIKPSISP